MNSDGYPLNSTFPDGITSDALVSLDETANIALGDGSISFNAATVEINGVPIVDIGNVFNPMLSALDCNNFSVLDANEMTASKFIVKDGPAIPGYLLSDGSILTNSGDGVNSNIYLYNNNLTITAPPANGQIRYNNASLPLATQIFVSHLTRDNIDIDAFLALISQLSIIYIQDQDSSLNYIRYNVIAPPTLTPNAFITIPVAVLDSSGTGSSNFPAGMNVFMSIFTNDIEIDTRLTTIETNTQNINASLIGTDFANNSSFILDPASSHSFTIRNNASPFSTAKFTVSNTSVQVISVPLLMNNQKITLLAAPVDNGDATRKVYVDDANALKLNLTGGTLTGAINMSNNQITSLAEPTNINHATTKNYTDTGLALKLNSVPTLIQQGGLKWAKVNAAVTQGSAVGTFDLIGTPLNIAIIGSTTFAPGEIPPFSTYVITVSGRITLPSSAGCSVRITMNGVAVDPISFGANPAITGGAFNCITTWTFRNGGIFSASVIQNLGAGSAATTGTSGGGGSNNLNTAIQQIMGVEFVNPTFTTPNITCYTITCIKL